MLISMLKINIGANYFNKAITDSSILPIAKSFFTKLDEDTTDWQIKMYLGAIALSEGNDSVAIENFKFVTENANWNVAAWVRLGGLYFDNRKYDEAEVVMSEAVISFPEDFYVNLILGLSLAQQSKHIEAEKYLKKLHCLIQQISPHFLLMLLHLINLKKMTKQYSILNKHWQLNLMMYS